MAERRVNATNSNKKGRVGKMCTYNARIFLSDGSLCFFSMEARLLTSALLKQSRQLRDLY
jgi:hypothetical protein